MKLATFLLALVQPVLARVLIALGFQVVTITGLVQITDTLKSQAISGLGLLQYEMLALFGVAGGPLGLGIIFGACTTKLLLWQIQSATKILGVNPG